MRGVPSEATESEEDVDVVEEGVIDQDIVEEDVVEEDMA
jgi:hypothetical protein